MTTRPLFSVRSRIFRGVVIGVVLLVVTHPLFAVSKSRARKRADKMLSFIPAVVATYTPNGELAGDDVKRLLAPQLLRMIQAGERVEKTHVREWVEALVDSMLRHRLLLEAAVAAGHVPADSLGRQRIAEMKAKIGKKAYRHTLDTQGVSEAEMGQKLAELGAIDVWISAVIVPECRPTESDMRTYYAENSGRYTTPELFSVSHIMIKADERAPKKERSLAKEKTKIILQKIRTEGSRFQDLAREYSDCPSRLQGGELGFFGRGRMVEAFEEALLGLQRGEISSVIETRYGFHIIRRGETIPSRQQSFSEVVGDIAKSRAERSIEELLRVTANRLRKERNVQILLGAK